MERTVKTRARHTDRVSVYAGYTHPNVYSYKIMREIVVFVSPFVSLCRAERENTRDYSENSCTLSVEYNQLFAINAIT